MTEPIDISELAARAAKDQQRAAMDAQQQQPPPGALVQPGPFAALLHQQVMPDGDTWVLLRIEAANGMMVFPLAPEDADQLGKNLRKVAREAKLGLTIIGNGHGDHPAGGDFDGGEAD